MPKLYRYHCLTHTGESAGYAYASSADGIRRERAEHLKSIEKTWASAKEEGCWDFEVVEYRMTVDGVLSLLRRCGGHPDNG